jgi:hypothetical protein
MSSISQLCDFTIFGNPIFFGPVMAFPSTTSLVLLAVGLIVAKVPLPTQSPVSCVQDSDLRPAVSLCRPHVPNKTSSRPVVHTLYALSPQTCCRYWPTYLLHRLAARALWPNRPSLANRSWRRGPRCLQGDTQDWNKIHEERMVS